MVLIIRFLIPFAGALLLYTGCSGCDCDDSGDAIFYGGEGGVSESAPGSYGGVGGQGGADAESETDDLSRPYLRISAPGSYGEVGGQGGAG